MNNIQISKDIFISEDELVFKASRSSGPGGQNVNKLNTRITLLFNIGQSTSISDDQKKMILNRLSTRIDKDGFVRVVSQKFRTQNTNRQAAIGRLRELLERALKPKPIRK